MKRVGNPVPSPNGDIAVYSVRQWTEATAKTLTTLDKLDLHTGMTAPLLTESPTNNHFNPLFSSDGSVVVFQGDDDNTIYQADVKTGKASVLVQLPVPVTSFKWAPNDKFIIFSAEVYLDCSDPQLECTGKRNAELESRLPNTGFVYSQLYVRHWDTWAIEGKYSHLFMLPIKKTGSLFAASGAPVDLQYKMNVASPVPPFGGVEQYDISPNGDEVAFTAETIEHDTAWKTGYKIYTVSTAAGSKPIYMTAFTQARCQDPLYSPSGRTLAYLCMDRPGMESDRLHFNLFDRSTGKTTFSLPAQNLWDRSVGGYTWASEDILLLDADDDADHKVFYYSISRNQVGKLIDRGHSAGLVMVGNSNKVLFSHDSQTAPADVFSFTFDSQALQAKDVRQLTSYNRDLLNQLDMPTPQKFYYTSNNTKIQGWYILPVGFKNGTQYPMVQLIHGGPEGAFSDAWSYRWNPQLFAAQGYITMYINPHGSTGFGTAFQDAVARDWGGRPFRDLMAGNDYIQKVLPIDNKRMCAAGASYGGFMINWINGHDHRFQCLINHDGVFSSMAMYYSSEEVFFNEYEFGPPPHTSDAAREAYEKFSPQNYVSQWRTPTLVIHGGKDYRIPISEGLSTFTALQRKGIESKLLYFPEENHWVLKPQNSIMWYDNVLSWVGAHTKA